MKPDPEFDPASASRGRLGLRAAAICAAVALHVVAIAAFGMVGAQALPTPLDSIDITIAPAQGEAVTETADAAAPDSVAQPEVQPTEQPKPDEPIPQTPPPPPDPTPPPPPDPTPPPPDPTPPPPPPDVPPPPDPIPPPADIPPPPIKDAPDAPPIVRRTPPKVVEKPRPKIDLEKLRREERKKREEERREETKREEARAAAQSARRARAGVERGSQTNAMSNATYGSRVRVEIQRHKVDPGEGGSVGVTFTIGASGSVVSAFVSSSSGNGRVDAAGLRAVRSAHPGPPPSGSFYGSTTINFVQR